MRWIKTYKKLIEWEWYKDSSTVHLFIHLIIKAEYKESNWRGIVIERGQLVTSRRILSSQTGISEQSIRTCLERLQSTHEITIKSTHRNSIITICNYDKYQGDEKDINPKNNPRIPRKSTSYQPSIIEEYIEYKEEKNNIYSFDDFWNDYDKKVGDKKKLMKKWEGISDSDKAMIKDYIPRYKKSQPDKKYRKNPETFFNNKSWNDEIIGEEKLPEPEPPKSKYQTV